MLWVGNTVALRYFGLVLVYAPRLTLKRFHCSPVHFIFCYYGRIYADGRVPIRFQSTNCAQRGFGKGGNSEVGREFTKLPWKTRNARNIKNERYGSLPNVRIFCSLNHRFSNTECSSFQIANLRTYYEQIKILKCNFILQSWGAVGIFVHPIKLISGKSYRVFFDDVS